MDRIAQAAGFDFVLYADRIGVSNRELAACTRTQVQRQGTCTQQIEFTRQFRSMEIGPQIAIDLTLYATARELVHSTVCLFADHPRVTVVQTCPETGTEVIEQSHDALGLDRGQGVFGRVGEITSQRPGKTTVEADTQRPFTRILRLEGNRRQQQQQGRHDG